MKKNYLLFLLLAATTLSYAQTVPGYKGKHTYLEYDLYTSPSFGQVTQNGNTFGFGEQKSLIAWNSRHKFTLNYVSKRNEEMGGSFSVGQTGILDNNNELGNLRFTSLGFHYNHYLVKSTGALAPLGRYVKAELQYLQAVATLPNISQIDYHLGYMGFGIGTRRVFNDLITFNLSMQTGFVFPVSCNSAADYLQYKKTVASRLFFHYIYEMNVGVGLLLF